MIIDAFEPYIVDLEPEIQLSLSGNVYRVPLDSPTLKSVSPDLLSSWANDLIANPQGAWRERITCDSRDESSKGTAEQIAADFLSRFRPTALVVYETMTWCEITSVTSTERRSRSFYIGERKAASINRERLSDLGFSRPKSLANFLAMMGGFRESIFPQGGYFESFDDRDILYTQDVMNKYFSGFSLPVGWDPSISIFTSLGGDTILCNRRGLCGWWEAGSWDTVRVLCADIDVLVEWMVSLWEHNFYRFVSL